MSDTKLIDSITCANIIFGIPINTERIITLNYCILLRKQYIYSQRILTKDMFFLQYLYILKTELELEKIILTIKHQEEKFFRWNEIYEYI